ncbi:MAG: hypothetical protein WCH34_09430 [Bacteroidota bacterium]
MNHLKILPITLILAFWSFLSVAQKSYDNSDSNAYKYNEFSAGIQFGTFQHFHQAAKSHQYLYWIIFIPVSGTGYEFPERKIHDLYCTSLGFATYSNRGLNERYYFKVNIAGAIDKSNDSTEIDGKKSDWLLVVNPLVGFDTKMIGINLQMTLGRLRQLDEKTGDKKNSLSMGKPQFTIAMPSFYVRIAPIRVIYADLRFGPGSFGMNTNTYPIMLGLGSGLGHDNGNFIHVNFGLSWPYAAFGLGCKFNFANSAIELEGLAHTYGSYGGITYSHKFGRKEISYKPKTTYNSQHQSKIIKENINKQNDIVLIQDTSFKNKSNRNEDVVVNQENINKEKTENQNNLNFEQNVIPKEKCIQIMKYDKLNEKVQKVITKGMKVKVVYFNADSLSNVKGMLSEINDSSIVVVANPTYRAESTGEEHSISIAVKSIKVISRKNPDKGIVMILGGSLAGVIGFILVFSTKSYTVDTFFNMVGGGLGGSLFIGGGSALFIAGIVSAIVNWKTFDTSKGWVISVKDRNK